MDSSLAFNDHVASSCQIHPTVVGVWVGRQGAVITGAASGIGKAAAAEFVKNGAKVIIADVQDDLGRSITAELGPAAAYTRCDVTDEAQIAASVDLAVERHGHLDILYNNAGVFGSGSSGASPVASLGLAEFDRIIAVNARATLAGVKHAARAMAPRRRGSILCTASAAGVLSPGMAPLYAVTKAAVIAMARTLAGPLARDGVRVNAVLPLGIFTPMLVRGMAEACPGVAAEELRRMVEMGWNELHGAVLEEEASRGRACTWRPTRPSTCPGTTSSWMAASPRTNPLECRRLRAISQQHYGIISAITTL